MQRLRIRMGNRAAANVIRRIAGNDVALGTAVFGVVMAIVIATIVLYAHPLGRRAVSFETADAAALQGGEDVRVAGMSIGKVGKVVLGQDLVRITMQVRDDVFVGKDSRVEVRMLTPVGGYYVTIIPIGTSSLGNQVISSDHVSMPYSIADVLQEAPAVTDKVEGDTVHGDLAQVAAGLQHNPGSVASVISGLDSIAQIMAKQREQIRTTLDLASEYSGKFNESRDLIFQFLRDLNTVVATYNINRAGFNETYQLLGDTVLRLVPEEQYFLDHKQDLRAAVDQLKQAISNFQGSAGPTIDQLTALRDQITAWLGPDGIARLGGGQILASQICLPVPGQVC
ncbi:MlaD family protein [Nocardia nepalensis]|uniref:MlaD family protein n=1 Tax=Nocardia nepalensis TaxID=3375448 RepID=UPI003B68337B